MHASLSPMHDVRARGDIVCLNHVPGLSPRHWRWGAVPYTDLQFLPQRGRSHTDVQRGGQVHVREPSGVGGECCGRSGNGQLCVCPGRQ